MDSNCVKHFRTEITKRKNLTLQQISRRRTPRNVTPSISDFRFLARVTTSTRKRKQKSASELKPHTDTHMHTSNTSEDLTFPNTESAVTVPKQI